jgi:hypothetical protein
MRNGLSLNDILNPDGIARRRERESELNQRAEIAAYGFQQADRHHSDTLDFNRSRLNLDAQTKTTELQQADRHHSDKMGALARQDDFDRRQLEITQQNAVVTAENNLTIAHERNETAITIAREDNRHDFDITQKKHENAMELVANQAHTNTMKEFSLLPAKVATSALQREEDLNRTFSAAIGNAFIGQFQTQITMNLEAQKEQYRANERKHEIELAEIKERQRSNERQHEKRLEVLKGALGRKGYSHQKTMELVAQFVAREGGLGEMDEDTLRRKFEEWAEHEAAKE